MSVLKYLNDTQTARLWAKIKAGFVSKSGDTMTGALTLAGDPVSDLQAATKKYVDDNAGGGGTPSTTTPKMDGTASAGSEDAYARGDHVHPTDTSRQAKITASGILKGDGSGGVTAAVAGTDYIASHQDISGKLDKSGGTMTGTLTLAGAPVSDLQASTKKYVDDSIASVDALPSQTGQSGKFLTTDGTDASWGTVDALPSQSGKNGKYLQTNGTSASWEDGPDNSFYAEYNVATIADVIDAYNAGKSVYTLVSGYSECVVHVPLAEIRATENDPVAIFTAILNGTYDNEIWVFSLRSRGWEPYHFTPLYTYGGTMTGALTLSGAPTADLHAATKKYVDDNIPSVPSATTTTPKMDGTAAVGSETKWAKGDHIHPTDTSRQAKITASGLLKGDGSGGVSAATAGTDYAAASHSHGNITSGGDITAAAPTIASGDQLVINDNSASKITNGPTFDGSTTTKALTPKGTWETFLTLATLPIYDGTVV